MDQSLAGPCGRQRIIWAMFVLALGLGWALSAAGIVDVSAWRFAGPLALVAVGVSMLWPKRGAI